MLLWDATGIAKLLFATKNKTNGLWWLVFHNHASLHALGWIFHLRSSLREEPIKFQGAVSWCLFDSPVVICVGVNQAAFCVFEKRSGAGESSNSSKPLGRLDAFACSGLFCAQIYQTTVGGSPPHTIRHCFSVVFPYKFPYLKPFQTEMIISCITWYHIHHLYFEAIPWVLGIIYYPCYLEVPF